MASSSSIEVSTATWPVVYVVYRTAGLRAGDLVSFHEALDRVLARGERFVTLIDSTRVRLVPNPLVLRKNEGWVERNQAALVEQSLGTVTIAKNALARGIAEWILHQRKVKTGGAVVSSLEEAVAWSIARLKERGVPFDEGRVSRLLLAEDGVDGGLLEQAHAEPDGGRRALVELVMSAFSEPAFLVDERGEVLFMNAPAEEVFEAVPAWVKRALEGGHSALRSLCRVVPLAVGSNVFVVVPHEELLPVRGQVARSLELPESLLKVAAPLARGLSDREISEVTGLSHTTVRTYVRRIFTKTGVRSRGAFIRQFAAGAERLQM